MMDQLLTMTEAAKRLRITDRHLDDLVKTDAGPHITIVEGEQYVQVNDLITWVAEQAKPAGNTQSTITTHQFIVDRFLTLKEAADQVGLSPHVLERRLKKKLGPPVEHYRGWPVIRPDHLAAWLASVECFGQAKEHDLDPAWGRSPRHPAVVGDCHEHDQDRQRDVTR